MIRLHSVLGKIRVSARRNPKGFLISSSTTVRDYRSGPGWASVNYTTEPGWEVQSMKGRRGPFFSEKQDAINFVVTDMQFQEDANEFRSRPL